MGKPRAWLTLRGRKRRSGAKVGKLPTAASMTKRILHLLDPEAQRDNIPLWYAICAACSSS